MMVNPDRCLALCDVTSLPRPLETKWKKWGQKKTVAIGCWDGYLGIAHMYLSVQWIMGNCSEKTQTWVSNNVIGQHNS